MTSKKTFQLFFYFYINLIRFYSTKKKFLNNKITIYKSLKIIKKFFFLNNKNYDLQVIMQRMQTCILCIINLYHKKTYKNLYWMHTCIFCIIKTYIFRILKSIFVNRCTCAPKKKSSILKIFNFFFNLLS